MHESQIQILEGLAHYKFLTVPHMIKIGVSPSREVLYRELKGIREAKPPYVYRQKMPVEAVKGKSPDVYYLSNKGVKWLEENLIMDRDEIRFPVGKTYVPNRDYPHRMATIDIHIALKMFLDSVDEEILNASAYFDKPGSQRKGEPLILNKITLTETSYLLPDLITRFTVGGDEKIIAWEQHNGSDTKKLLRQVENHIIALRDKLIGKKYGVDKFHRVGIVFEKQSILEASVKRLFELYGESDSLYKFFIFKTNEEVQGDFLSNWKLWNGTTTTFIQ